MLEVIHREATAEDGGGWVFDCPAAMTIQGGGRTYRASVATAEHAVRHHLSHLAGYPVAPEDAAELLRHLRATEGPS